MVEPAVVIVRLLQYTGAVILMGSSLFFLYALPKSGAASAARLRWARPLLVSAAALLAGSSLLAIGVQASLFAGSFSAGFTGEAIGAVISFMDLGKAALLRSFVAALAVATLLVLPPGRASWTVAAALGVVATASLPWMGHGAVTEGSVGLIHLTSAIVHALAAAIWIGALTAFVLLVLNRTAGPGEYAALHTALRRFSGVGSVVVAALILTGLISGWILVGLDELPTLLTTPYGRLLSAKLVLFAAMLALAAANRFRLAPSFGRSLGDQLQTGPSMRALQRSVALEAALAFAVLILVAWLGTLAPPAEL